MDRVEGVNWTQKKTEKNGRKQVLTSLEVTGRGNLPMVAKSKKLYCLGASGCKEPLMHTERGLKTPCMELPWKLWLRVPLTAAPISLWSAPVIWVTQGWCSKQADSNDIIATDRFLKGRKISNGHASFENFPSVGGRWKGLSAQIWHVLPTLLAAYQFTSETFLLQIFFLQFLLFLVNRTSFEKVLHTTSGGDRIIMCHMLVWPLPNKHLVRSLFPNYYSTKYWNKKRLFFCIHFQDFSRERKALQLLEWAGSRWSLPEGSHNKIFYFR